MEDYAIIYNPVAAAGKCRKAFEKMQSELNKRHVKYKLYQTEYFTHGIGLSEELARDGYRVIGAGGDGTCNEVLNGVINSKSNTPIGFIPIGTGNDIPATIGYAPGDVTSACEIIAQGKISKADVGKVINNEGKTRFFLGIGSQGFDALVTKRTNEGKKRLNGSLNYVNSVVRTVFSFNRQMIKIKHDHGEFIGQCNLVAVANGPTYGGGMHICPKADPCDGLFHISVVNMNVFELLTKFNRMFSNTLHPDTHIIEIVSKKVEISMGSSTIDPYMIQVDGELHGTLSAKYECLKNYIDFIIPKENLAKIQFHAKFGRKHHKHRQNLSKKGISYWD